MTALPHDTEADLRRRILELEQRLQSIVAQRDEAIERQTAAALVNFRLQNELRATVDRQKAGAEILRTIAAAPTDAEQSLQRIAETTARFFNASSATIRISDGNRWTRTIAVGRASERIVAAVPTDQLAIDGKNLPGMVYARTARSTFRTSIRSTRRSPTFPASRRPAPAAPAPCPARRSGAATARSAR